MIEVNQPFQCLFCPQRRKIALVLKVVLALSAALVMGLLLFPPRSVSNSGRESHVSGADDRSRSSPTRLTTEKLAIDSLQAEPLPQKRAAVPFQKKFHELQEQLKSILGSQPVHFNQARQLLQSRQKEILITKVLLLGEQSAEALPLNSPEKRVLLESLDQEFSILSDQLRLLSKAEGKE